jgi:hypothetical protein
MINLFFTISAMIFTLFYVIQSRKREFVSKGISNGSICYKCKNDIEDEDIWKISYSPKLCKSCERDEKLGSVLNSNKIGNNLFKYRKNWFKITIVFNILSMFFNLLSIYSKIFSPIGGICLFISMGYFYISYISMSRKKKNATA